MDFAIFHPKKFLYEVSLIIIHFLYLQKDKCHFMFLKRMIEIPSLVYLQNEFSIFVILLFNRYNSTFSSPGAKSELRFLMWCTSSVNFQKYSPLNLQGKNLQNVATVTI